MCNKQSKAKTKTNRQKHKKLTELVGTSRQKTQRHGCRVSWAVTPASARDSVIQINAGLAAQPENKSAETRRKMKRGGSQNMQQMRGCRNLWGSLIFRTLVFGYSGLRQKVNQVQAEAGAAPTSVAWAGAWERAQRIKSWHVFQLGINYRDSKNWTILRKLTIPFWITENILMFRFHLFTLNNAVMHLSPDYRVRINKPVQGWLRLTPQLLLLYPRCFPVICWVLKKPACGIKKKKTQNKTYCHRQLSKFIVGLVT